MLFLFEIYYINTVIHKSLFKIIVYCFCKFETLVSAI